MRDLLRNLFASLQCLLSPARCLDAVLGSRCRYHCQERVYPRDRAAHELAKHGGDQ